MTKPLKLCSVEIQTLPIGATCINTKGTMVLWVTKRIKATDGSLKAVFVRVLPKWRGGESTLPPTYLCFPFRLASVPKEASKESQEKI
jgi:hypothetical protein